MADDLASLIAKKRPAIIGLWFDSAIQSYPPDTAAFLQSQKDPFANPVGSNTRAGIEGLFDQLLGPMDAAAVARHLDPIMRIRAVQSFAPSQATGFIFELKALLRRLLAPELKEGRRLEELSAIDARIDRIGLKAFDIYMACREQVFEFKANETRNRTFRAFERAGLVAKSSGQEPERGGNR
jgi:hypothetical protein